MRILTAISSFIFLALLANGMAEDSRLLGTWKSDQQATLDYLSTKTNIPQKILDILKPVLGKLTVTYTPDKAIFRNCELAGTYGYRILASNKDCVRLQMLGTDGEEGPISMIYFVGHNSYWSVKEHSKIHGYREMFVKIEETKKP